MTPLALTMGDPAGIGPEITRDAWAALRHGVPFVLLADPALYPGARVVRSAAEASSVFADALPILPVKLGAAVVAGEPNPANAAAVIASIERATRLTQAGETAAVVTNPISKATLYGAGFAYPGHTEYLAALTGTALPVMMLAAPALRVVPITIHISLRQALDTLTTAMIVQTTRITAASLRRDFGLARPRIAIAGLNPHAGEQGAMGDEETTLIQPAIDQLRAEGHDISGPWPPDTMFTARARPQYDVAMCMYHDQALIPLKTLDMDGGVNVTLGLPIIRTSPDHGTAFGIAGRGIADPSSLIAAIRFASDLVSRKETVPC
jgi:4-hydroxythreonine-4-phosphate dehydrogenase